MTSEIDAIAAAARALPLEPRGERWAHLSLCLLDAVFSINANYASTRRAVRRYAVHAGLEPVTAPAAEVATGLHASIEQPLTAFLADVGGLDPEAFATVLRNRQVTSSTSGIRKAEAVQRYALILVDHGIDTLADTAALLADVEAAKRVERDLAAVPGHGSGVRVSYLWMLVGDDQHVKADRMVMRWLGRVLDRPVDVKQSTALLGEAAVALEVTPWVLDHTIWTAQRGR